MANVTGPNVTALLRAINLLVENPDSEAARELVAERITTVAQVSYEQGYQARQDELTASLRDVAAAWEATSDA